MAQYTESYGPQRPKRPRQQVIDRIVAAADAIGADVVGYSGMGQSGKRHKKGTSLDHYLIDRVTGAHILENDPRHVAYVASLPRYGINEIGVGMAQGGVHAGFGTPGFPAAAWGYPGSSKVALNARFPDHVKALQQTLADMGAYDGPIDGVVGPLTNAALGKVNIKGITLPPADIPMMTARDPFGVAASKMAAPLPGVARFNAMTAPMVAALTETRPASPMPSYTTALAVRDARLASAVSPTATQPTGSWPAANIVPATSARSINLFDSRVPTVIPRPNPRPVAAPQTTASSPLGTPGAGLRGIGSDYARDPSVDAAIDKAKMAKKRELLLGRETAPLYNEFSNIDYPTAGRRMVNVEDRRPGAVTGRGDITTAPYGPPSAVATSPRSKTGQQFLDSIDAFAADARERQLIDIKTGRNYRGNVFGDTISGVRSPTKIAGGTISGVRSGGATTAVRNAAPSQGYAPGSALKTATERAAREKSIAGGTISGVRQNSGSSTAPSRAPAPTPVPRVTSPGAQYTKVQAPGVARYNAVSPTAAKVAYRGPPPSAPGPAPAAALAPGVARYNALAATAPKVAYNGPPPAMPGAVTPTPGAIAIDATTGLPVPAGAMLAPLPGPGVVVQRRIVASPGFTASGSAGGFQVSDSDRVSPGSKATYGRKQSDGTVRGTTSSGSGYTVNRDGSISTRTGTYTQNRNGRGYSKSKIICTYFYLQGRLPRDIWRADQRWGATRPALLHIGYHAWADPAVRAMEKQDRLGRLLERVLFPLANAWAREAAYLASHLPKGTVKGKLARLILEPPSYLIGLIVTSRLNRAWQW